MALQTSGAISLNDIQGEFGSSNPISINEYYRGGANVPNTSVNNSIPTSGTIAFSNFYGGASASVDNNVSFTMQEYTIGSGKIAFQYRGANSSMSDGSLTTNNLNSYTITDIAKVFPDPSNIFGMAVTFSGTGNGYNAYTTGLVRGLSWSGGSASFNTPSSGNNTLNIPAVTSLNNLLQNNLGNSVTMTFTY